MKNPVFIGNLKLYLDKPEGQKALINLKIGALNAIGSIVTEVLFTMMPVGILLGISLYKQSGENFWSIPEWSFISTVLFGQSITRILSALSKINRSFNPITTNSVIALVIVCGLIPSIMILVLMLLEKNPSVWLTFMQMAMFTLSIISLLGFIFLNHVASELANIAEIAWPDYIEPKTAASTEKTVNN